MNEESDVAPGASDSNAARKSGADGVQTHRTCAPRRRCTWLARRAVSARNARYSESAASLPRSAANRVFAIPGLGSFAKISSNRPAGVAATITVDPLVWVVSGKHALGSPARGPSPIGPAAVAFPPSFLQPGTRDTTRDARDPRRTCSPSPPARAPSSGRSGPAGPCHPRNVPALSALRTYHAPHAAPARQPATLLLSRP